MTFSNALPIFAACSCRKHVVLSLLDDVSTAWPCREVQALGLFTDCLKCAESISLKQIQWTGGSHLRWCISTSALSLRGRQSLLVLYTAGYVLCSLSGAVWGETATARQPDCYALLHAVYFVRGVDPDISLLTEHNTRKPQMGCWAHCT